MRILILANPHSGRGKAARAAEAARTCLIAGDGGGHSVAMVTGGPQSDPTEIARAARDADLLVVAGGDGSVHHAAPIAMQAGIPLYHLPCGNENLLAREFGMTRRPKDLAHAIESWNVTTVDVGTIEAAGAAPRHFLLMISFGPDADIVHRLTASRTRATGHLAYATPIAAEFLAPHLPRLTVTVDQRKVVDQRRGVLVVANCRQYAFRIDPCHRASMTDGNLDVLFMPCEGRWGVLGWAWKCRKRAAASRGAVAATGKSVTVEGEGAWQVDGELGGSQGSSAVMRLGIQGKSLRVLGAAV